MSRLPCREPSGSQVLRGVWCPAYRAPFNERTDVTPLVLEPLVDADALARVRATLGIHNLPDGLAQVIARKAEGNPFCLLAIAAQLDMRPLADRCRQSLPTLG